MKRAKIKFFHLSDLHIGLKLLNRDLQEDQIYILKKIVELAEREQPDAVVIAGDIYDKPVPSAEAVGVFDTFLQELTGALPQAEILLISGNHDSAGRLDCYRSLLARQRVHMIGQPPRTKQEHIEKVTLQDRFGAVNFYLLPFVKPTMVKEITGVREDGTNMSYHEAVHALIDREQIDPEQRNVIVSHQFYLPKGISADEIERADSEIRSVGNIDEVCADVLKQFDYAALGHIHKPMKVGSETIRYCGTPLACSVSEADQQKSVLVVELGEKGTAPLIRELPLVPLRRVRVEKGELVQVLKHPSEDYVSVVLTDREDLDVIDMQERLRDAFPNLLEIRRENMRRVDYSGPLTGAHVPEPYELCRAFLGELDASSLELLRDVVNAAKEVAQG